VDVLSQCGHAGWEFGSVLNNLIGGFVAVDLPAVIQIDVLVTLGCQPSADHEIDGLLDEGFVDVAVEAVPGVPAHGGCSGEPVVQSPCRYGQEK